MGNAWFAYRVSSNIHTSSTHIHTHKYVYSCALIYACAHVLHFAFISFFARMRSPMWLVSIQNDETESNLMVVRECIQIFTIKLKQSAIRFAKRSVPVFNVVVYTAIASNTCHIYRNRLAAIYSCFTRQYENWLLYHGLWIYHEQ